MTRPLSPRTLPQALLLAAALTTLAAPPVSAHCVKHHCRHPVARAPAPRPTYNPASDWQFDVIEDLTRRAQHEPGVTSELAPDAHQTATGGPSGGVPGFSGD